MSKIMINGKGYDRKANFLEDKKRQIDTSIEKSFEQRLIDAEKENDLSMAMGKVDEDIMDDKTGMSLIDMNSYLKNAEQFNAVTKIDMLANGGFLPKRVKKLTQQFKRNTRGREGFGSKQKENIAIGGQYGQQMKQAGMFGKLFGGK